MRNLFIIFIFLILSSCCIKKQVNDTEQIWIGNNKEKFYE